MRVLGLAAALPVTVVVMAACSGGGSDPVIEMDAAPPMAACNPVDDSGCAAGEKCSLLVEATEPALQARTACVPAGTLALGEVCTTAFENPGPLAEGKGFDSCVAKTFCLRGVCTEICELDTAKGIDTCPADEKACGVYTGVFAEFARDTGSDTAGVGMCDALCDLFDPAACPASQACYLSLPTGLATCTSNTSKGAVGTACAGLNSCDLGLGCILQDTTKKLYCTPYCDTTTGLTPAGMTCGEALGGQPGDARCLAINRFYNNVLRVDARYGMCADCADPRVTPNPACSQTATESRSLAPGLGAPP